MECNNCFQLNNSHLLKKSFYKVNPIFPIFVSKTTLFFIVGKSDKSVHFDEQIKIHQYKKGKIYMTVSGPGVIKS